MVAEETNKYASLSQRKSVITDLNWEDTCVKEVKEYTDVLVVCVCVCVCARACVRAFTRACLCERESAYGNSGSASIRILFVWNHCVCTIVGQVMTVTFSK